MIVNTQCLMLKEGTAAVRVQVGFANKENTFSLTINPYKNHVLRKQRMAAWIKEKKERLQDRHKKYNSRNERRKRVEQKSYVRRLNLE